jgi:hypothetical protein
MRDHEYFSKQMEITLGIFQSPINKAAISQAQKNKMLALAREWRDFAYQVGRTEAFSGQAAGLDDMFRYPEQFDDTINTGQKQSAKYI